MSQLQVYLRYLLDILEPDPQDSPSHTDRRPAAGSREGLSLAVAGERQRLTEGLSELLYLLDQFAARPELSGEWLEFKVGRVIEGFDRLEPPARPEPMLS